METVLKGYSYIWKIENIRSYIQTVLDSPIVPCYTGVDFHFHMTITSDGNLSFYMHYKAETGMPKYTYYFGTKTGALPRQHTAYRIPAGTERCGHCNVVNMSEIYKIMPENDETLFVFFTWDTDRTIVSSAANAEAVATWTVINVGQQRMTPLTSKGFNIGNAVLAVRADEMTADDIMFFVFAKEGSIPPHSISVRGPQQAEIAQLEPSEEPGAKILKVKKAEFKKFCGDYDDMTVVVAFMKKNPLDFFNNAAQAEQRAKSEPAPKTIDIGGGEKGKEYVVMEDEV